MCKDGTKISPNPWSSLTSTFSSFQHLSFRLQSWASQNSASFDVRGNEKTPTTQWGFGVCSAIHNPVSRAWKCDPPLRVDAWKLHVEATLKALPNLGTFGIQRIQNADIFAANLCYEVVKLPFCGSLVCTNLFDQSVYVCVWCWNVIWDPAFGWLGFRAQSNRSEKLFPWTSNLCI